MKPAHSGIPSTDSSDAKSISCIYFVIAASVGDDSFNRNNIELTVAGKHPTYDNLFSDKRKSKFIKFRAIALTECGIRHANGFHKQH